MEIKSDGDVHIIDGDIVFEAAGNGICLGVTSNTDSNTLDDYEEGTWTPAVAVNSDLSIGTVHQNRYTKIGQVVTLNAAFNLNSSAVPSSGDSRVTGFPFSINNFSNGAFPIGIHYNYKVTPTVIMHSNGYIYYQSTAVGGNNLNPIGDALDAVSTVSLTFSYITT